MNNTQYEKIMRRYDERQIRRNRLIEERKKEVYEKVPEYREIDNQIASMSIKAGLEALSSNNSHSLNLSEEIENLRVKKGLLLTQAGFSINYLDPPYVCDICKDTGFVGTNKCSCLKQAILDLSYEQSNIKNMLYEENFDTLSHDYQTNSEDRDRFIQAETAAKNLCENFEKEHGNLLLLGPVGTGKSFLSNCIANEIIKRGHSVIYFSAISLFEHISSYKFSKDKYSLENPLNDIYSCDLLVIDDLGSEITNNFVCTELFNIINERHLRKKSTVISTNLNPQEIAERYSSRIYSRIHLYYDKKALSGDDIRNYIKRIEKRK